MDRGVNLANLIGLKISVGGPVVAAEGYKWAKASLFLERKSLCMSFWTERALNEVAPTLSMA